MHTQDAIKKYLLSKKNRAKLSIFTVLASKVTFIPIGKLSERFQIKEKNLSIYLQELEKELQSLNQNCSIVLLKHQKLIKLAYVPNEVANCYHRLFASYCKESTNYLIITSLLDKDTQSMIAISQKTNFSVSHVYSKMKVINEFLSLYGIHIKFSKNGKKIIEGTEVQLQYCILDVYWNVFSNTELPFKQESEQTKKEIEYLFLKKNIVEKLTGGMLDKLYLLLKICRENFPMTSFGLIKEEFQQNYRTEVYLNPLFDILKEDVPITKEQRILINILARLSISKAESDTENYQQYQFLSEEKIPLFLSSKHLVESFIHEFNLEILEENKILFVLNFMRSQLYMRLFAVGQPVAMLPSFFVYQQLNSEELKQKIASFCQDFLEQEKITISNHDWLVSSLYHLYTRYQPKRKIKIGVNLTRDYHINEDVSLYIEQTFGKETVELKSNELWQCEIIVSDCTIPLTNPQTKIIYLLNSEITVTILTQLMKQIAVLLFELRND